MVIEEQNLYIITLELKGNHVFSILVFFVTEKLILYRAIDGSEPLTKITQPRTNDIHYLS